MSCGIPDIAQADSTVPSQAREGFARLARDARMTWSLVVLVIKLLLFGVMAMFWFDVTWQAPLILVSAAACGTMVLVLALSEVRRRWLLALLSVPLIPAAVHVGGLVMYWRRLSYHPIQPPLRVTSETAPYMLAGCVAGNRAVLRRVETRANRGVSRRIGWLAAALGRSAGRKELPRPSG